MGQSQGLRRVFHRIHDDVKFVGRYRQPRQNVRDQRGDSVASLGTGLPAAPDT
jgi:hypothetical protein